MNSDVGVMQISLLSASETLKFALVEKVLPFIYIYIFCFLGPRYTHMVCIKIYCALSFCIIAFIFTGVINNYTAVDINNSLR